MRIDLCSGRGLVLVNRFVSGSRSNSPVGFPPNSRTSRRVAHAARRARIFHKQGFKIMFAPTCVGIDVAKAHLDVYRLPDNKRLRVANTFDGHQKLLKFFGPLRPDRIILEATGGYERAVLFTLMDQGHAAVVLNPTDVRNFAKSRRIRAKNDQMDAKVLAEFGQANPTRVVGQSQDAASVLKQLVMLRRQLVCQRARLRNQLEHADVTMVRQVIDRNIKNLDKELKDVQKMIQDQIDADPALARRQQLLQQAAGVGRDRQPGAGQRVAGAGHAPSPKARGTGGCRHSTINPATTNTSVTSKAAEPPFALPCIWQPSLASATILSSKGTIKTSLPAANPRKSPLSPV